VLGEGRKEWESCRDHPRARGGGWRIPFLFFEGNRHQSFYKRRTLGHSGLLAAEPVNPEEEHPFPVPGNIAESW